MKSLSTSQVRVDSEELRQYVTDLFAAAGLDENQARTIARHLVLANLRGVDSHGVSRVEIYTKRLDLGLLNKQADFTIERETATSALINAQNSSGIVVSTKGIELAVEKAKQSGIGIVAINSSNHCGMLADYTMYAAEHDCLALATTNAPSNMPPWGGKDRFFGTNPISYSIPAGEEDDIIFDAATSLVARGKIIVAQKNGQQIPLGWAVSTEGKPTTDPTEALKGVVLPAGEHKGSGIALLVEALSSLYSGAAFGPHIGDLYTNFSKPQNVGQCFIVMRADLFQPLQQFKDRVDQMIREIRQVPKMDGVDRIYLPGEKELEMTKEREVNGVPLTMGILNELVKVGKRYGVACAWTKNVS